MNSPQEREIVSTVANEVSNALKKPVEQLPPLSEEIDLDALDTIVPTDSSRNVTVTFTYEGLHVFVHSGRIVRVRQPREKNL